MNYEFIFIQLLGLLAWCILALSYYRENTNKILAFHLIASAIYALHYYLLGAYSGFFITIFEIFRDYGFYKTDADKYIFLASIPIYIVYAILSYKVIYDILPLVACLLDGWSLTKHKKIVVVGATIEYILWVIYNLKVGSYTGAVTDGLIVLANISILIYGDRFFEDKEKFNTIFNK